MNKLFDDRDFIIHQKKSFQDLDFTMLPFITLLGKLFLAGEITQTDILSSLKKNLWYKKFLTLKMKEYQGTFHASPTLLILFGWDQNKFSRTYFHAQVKNFFLQEVAFIKKRPEEKLVKENTQSIGELSALASIGAEILILIVKDFRWICTKIQKTDPEGIIDCRYLMRYILNGWHERYWYQKANKQIREIFPDEDPRIIIDFLAITSQNATVEDNVVKCVKALKQFKEGKTYDVHMKLSKGAPMVESTFNGGFLHAQIKYLNDIARNGKLISDGSVYTKSARKIRNFARAMNGDVNAFALDYWIHIAFKAIETDKVKRKEIGSPSASFYRKVYYFVRLLSRITGIPPREIQAMIWVGIRSQRTIRSQMHYAPILKALLRETLFKPETKPS